MAFFLYCESSLTNEFEKGNGYDSRGSLCIENDLMIIAGNGIKYEASYDVITDNIDTVIENIKASYVQYAFAIIDKSSGKAHLIRDYSGCEPLYYSYDSSKRAILISDSWHKIADRKECNRINVKSAFSFLYYEFFAQPNTFLNDIYSVLNGETKIVNLLSGEATSVSDDFYLGEEKCSHKDETKYFNELRENIAEAHKSRLGRNNVIYMSGGIDSQVMAISLKKDLGISNIAACNFSVKGAEQSESKDASKVAHQLGIDFIHSEVDPDEDLPLEELIKKSNSPYIGIFSISQLINKVKSDTSISPDSTFYSGQDTRLHTPALSMSDIKLWDFMMNKPFLSKIISLGARGALPLLEVINGDKSCSNYKSRLLYLLSSLDSIGDFLSKRHFHMHPFKEIRSSGYFLSEMNDIVDTLNTCKNQNYRDIYNSIVHANWRRQYLFDIEYMVGTTRGYGYDCVMPFYDKKLAIESSRLPFNLATKLSIGRDGHSASSVKVNKYILRSAYEGDLDKSLIFRDKAVCKTNHMFLNGCLDKAIQDFIHHPSLLDIQGSEHLNIGMLIELMKAKRGKWAMSDQNVSVVVMNALLLDGINKMYC